MAPSPLFVGRDTEQDEFIEWMSSEPTPEDHGRAALLIGPAGMGKSALLGKFEQLCIARRPKDWYVQRVLLNANESPSSFLARLLIDAHKLFKGKYLRSGPRDERILKGLLKAVPKLGSLLVHLVDEDKRPGWQRFIDYLEALSRTLQKSNGRFVLLIDPDRAMQEGQVDDWLTIAKRLPPHIRVVIAQRPDDVIASHAESKLCFITIPSSGSLPELDEDGVRKWYDYEFRIGRLKDEVPRWPADVRRTLPPAALAHYRGHPFAHDALIRLLLTDPVDDPVKAIAQWPPDLAALLDMLFRSLSIQGNERRQAAFALQVFSMSTPLQVWAKAAELSEDQLADALDDPRYAHFYVKTEDDVYAPFHLLFAERLERELERLPEMRVERADAAWRAIEPHLDPEVLATSIPNEYALLAATSVAARFTDPARVLEAVDRVAFVKERLGHLDAAEADHLLVLTRYGGAHEGIRAIACCNLGNLLFMRGDLDGAEAMHRKSLRIDEKLGNVQGVAKQYGSLGNLLLTRGDLDGAEAMYRRALKINEKLGHDEGMASDYGNLGIVLRVRGDLEGAEAMQRKVLVSEEKLGSEEGMADAYGNLGNVLAARGDLDGAEAMHREALVIDKKLGNQKGMAEDYGNIGAVLERRGDLDGARDLRTKARDLFRKIGMPHMVEKVQRLLDESDDLKQA